MEKIAMPGTDLAVSRLCAGCMGLGGGWERGAAITKEHERQAEAFIDAALGLGINFFDHANIYARGRAEEVFGRVLRARPALRGSIVLQSKCRHPLGRRSPALAPALRLQLREYHVRRRGHPDSPGHRLSRHPAAPQARRPVGGRGDRPGLRRAQGRRQGALLRCFQPEPGDDGVPSVLPARSPRGEPAPDEPPPPRLRGNRRSPSTRPSPGYPDGWEGVVEYCRLKGVSLQAWSPLDRGALTGALTAAELASRPESERKTAALVARYALERGLPARGDSPRLAPQASGGDRADPGHDKAGAPRGLRQGSRGEAQP